MSRLKLCCLGVLAFLLVVGACATARAPRDLELNRIVALLVGDYSSAAGGGVREGRAIYMRIRSVTPPQGRRVALYAEMRHDDAAGEIYRQRLYVFDETPGRLSNVMTALAFDDSATAASLIENPHLAPGLATKNPLAEGCAAVWQADGAAFIARVDPATCQITGKRGDQRRIESLTRISANGIGQLERGYDLDGRLLFGNPAGDLYFWPRVK